MGYAPLDYILIEDATDRLEESDRGRAALVALRGFLSDHYLGLDKDNQCSVIALLEVAKSRPGSVREAIDAAIE